MFDTTLPQEEDIRPPCPATDDQADNLGLFLRETHHRMKNTLTLLGAWLRADFISTASVDLPKAIDGFERRIWPLAGSTIFSQTVPIAATLLLVTMSDP
jgi:two-component sensor histidine kinase